MSPPVDYRPRPAGSNRLALQADCAAADADVTENAKDPPRICVGKMRHFSNSPIRKMNPGDYPRFREHAFFCGFSINWM